MAYPEILAPNPRSAFPRLPVALPNSSQAAFGVGWNAEDDFGEPFGNVLGGDWSPAGFGGPGELGPTGGGGPGGGANIAGQAGPGPDFGPGAGVASGGAAGATGGGSGGSGSVHWQGSQQKCAVPVGACTGTTFVKCSPLRVIRQAVPRLLSTL